MRRQRRPYSAMMPSSSVAALRVLPQRSHLRYEGTPLSWLSSGLQMPLSHIVHG